MIKIYSSVLVCIVILSQSFSQNVGVGTATPNSKLEIQGLSGDENSAGILRLSNTSGNTNLRFGTLDGSRSWIQSYASLPLHINRLGNNVILNELGGNVGIGTASPSAQLHTTGTVRLANYASGSNGAILRTDGSGNLAITNFTGNANQVLRGDGTFGTATTSGTAWQLTGNSLAGTEFIGSTNAEPFIIRTNNLERMRILSTGNVGIGTTSPYSERGVRLETDGGISSNQTFRNRVGTNMGLWRDDGAILNLPWGRMANQNPDFLMSSIGSYGINFPTGWMRYNNAGGNTLTASVIADNTAPNASGKIMRISYDGNGSTSPGFGGFVISLTLQDGPVSAFNRYKRGTRIYFIVWAKIPSGRSIAAASNATGDGGNDVWLTPTAGTDKWERYVRVRTVGETNNANSWSSTGHFYIAGGTNTAFHWDVAACYVIMVDEDFPQVHTSYLNVGHKPDVTLNWGQMLTTQATYLAVDGGSVGIGTTSPTAQLHTTGTVRFANYSNGTLQVDASGNLSVGTGSSLFTAGTGLSWSGNILNSVWTASGNNIYNNNSGNVGIGTTGPAAGLDINRGATNNLALALRSSGAGWGSGMQFINTASGARNYGIYAGSDSKWHFADVTAGADRMIIDGTGNVGIGTTAPAAKLDVVGGDIRTNNYLRVVSWPGYGTGDFNIWHDGDGGSGTGAGLQQANFRVGSTNVMDLQSNGNVRVNNLAGTGDQRLVRATSNGTLTANIQMLYGNIDHNGNIRAGSSGGFSINHRATGIYRVNFTNAFNNLPICVCAQYYPNSGNNTFDNTGDGGSTRDNALVVGVTTNWVDIKTGEAGGSASNRSFTFICVGNR